MPAGRSTAASPLLFGFVPDSGLNFSLIPCFSLIFIIFSIIVSFYPVKGPAEYKERKNLLPLSLSAP
jgi:hypothetical protein